MLVLDLADVTFMDSMGLSLLVDTYKRAAAHKIGTVLRNPSAAGGSAPGHHRISELF